MIVAAVAFITFVVVLPKISSCLTPLSLSLFLFNSLQRSNGLDIISHWNEAKEGSSLCVDVDVA